MPSDRPNPDFFQCRKCGTHGEHSRQYIPPRQKHWVNGGVFEGECIIRRCRSCGYAFAEQCADARDTLAA